ncbi:MAG: threonine ammonia-lyase [Oscillospiraceae bacterium]|nr:threonine ammonia-lyase [Oscillospiraceae bacterium]
MSDMNDLTLESVNARIEKAAAFFSNKDIVYQTEFFGADNLVKADYCSLYLKLENLLTTGSFKLRGAYYRMSLLTDDEKIRGVVACSAGNHAQGVALAAQKLGVKATIFLPTVAPLYKVEATKRIGGDNVEVKKHGTVYDDTYQAAWEYCQQIGATFIHPFNNIDVIAGQGTVGHDIIKQCKSRKLTLDAVIVPVGGGGLISGVAAAVKHANPDCKVYGVQASGASGMCRSFKSGKLQDSKYINTFADGIAVRSPGKLTYEMCKQYVDDIVTVQDDEIATAILKLLEHHKCVSEGAGAVAVAAAMHGKLPLHGKRVCAIVSGGNIDINILSRVINRGLLTTGRFTELLIEMLDKPGSLAEVSAIIANVGANVVKLSHDQGGKGTKITGCYLSISLETKDRKHLDEVINALKAKGYKVIYKESNYEKNHIY